MYGDLWDTTTGGISQPTGIGRESTTSPLESIAAGFIRVLSECNGGMSDLGLGANEPAPIVPNDLASLENLMMMDSNTAAAVQAAKKTHASQ